MNPPKSPSIIDKYVLQESPKSIEFPCIKMEQPIGTFYIASLDSKIIKDITYFDIREIRGERGLDQYLGIQRTLNKNRVKELEAYVNTSDACFPTAIILAVHGVCAKYDGKSSIMTLSNYLSPGEGENPISFNEIAKVLDGQHRIEGLRGYQGDKTFDVNVSIFVDIDLSDQAYIFSTVNLAQTKVNRSLVYDLYELAKTRSPQKTCHVIAVALDKNSKSPFFKSIKRLGVTTEGRFNEFITQATFVQSLIGYISPNLQTQINDRELYLKGKIPAKATDEECNTLIFRNLFIDGKDLEIADVIWNYFDAVKDRWSSAWNRSERGNILNKTNGFRALMRFLRPAYLDLLTKGTVPSKNDFKRIFDRINIGDDEFNTDIFKPGTSGESELYKRLLKESSLK